MSRSAVVIDINGDATRFNNELKKVESQTKDLSNNLAKVGAAASVAFLGLSAAIAGTVNEYRQGVAVQKQTEAIIAATGGAAGVTADEVARLALSLQKVTNFGDEAVQSAQNIILRYKNIKEDIFPQTTELALDLATALGTDLSSATTVLAKALNNPLKGMDQLRKQGIVFTEAQREVIKNLLETGRVADAQALILQKVAGTVGGAARAAADPFVQLKEVMGDLAQAIGGVFYPAALAVVTALKNFTFYLLESNPQLVKLAAYGIAGAAALTGLVAAATLGAAAFLKVSAVWTAYSASAGIASIASKGLALSFNAVGVAVRFMLGPIGLAVTAIAAIGYAIYANKEKVVAFFSGIKAGFESLARDLSGFTSGASKVIEGLFTFSPSKLAEGSEKLRQAMSQGFGAAGTSAAQAFTEAYNKSISEQEMAAFTSEKTSTKIEDPAGGGELDPDAAYEYEIELEKQKKKEKLDLEKQYQEELRALKDESDQLDLNSELYKQTELARMDLDEKKRKLSDEAKYGKAVSDVKAFFRKEEVTQTGEALGHLATLTRSHNRELFELGKVAAFASATISIAEGIAKAIAQGGFFGLFMGAAVAAAGAVQLATITGTTMNAAKGFSGSGSPFGESFVSTFTPREIVVPERFAEGIKKGEFALTSDKEPTGGAGAAFDVSVSLVGDAADLIEVQQIQRRKLGISRG